MKCEKCGNTMIKKHYYDARDPFDPQFLYAGYSCVICGDIIDPVILANREKVKDKKAK